jgi:hypothetical protein
LQNVTVTNLCNSGEKLVDKEWPTEIGTEAIAFFESKGNNPKGSKASGMKTYYLIYFLLGTWQPVCTSLKFEV